MNNKDNKLDSMRHSASHVMAIAVLELFPQAKFAIGPAIENGFYYDFDLDRPLTTADLKKIEKIMYRIRNEAVEFIQENWTVKRALKFFTDNNQPYKVELIEDLVQDDPSLKKVSIYKTAKFTDLCAGPHVKNTKEIGEFKLQTVAGAYWRGNEKNKMLQRIYGTNFATKEELANYLALLEEAKKRDHRIIGERLNLFMIDPMVGLGLVMWKPKGAMLWRTMEDFWYKEHLKNGYELVRTPHIGNRKLWEASGHWGFYNESMYPPMEVGQSLSDAQKGKKAKIKEEYLIKPMNCPFHIRMYQSEPRSYRDLPIRWAETGTVYRYEKSGELSGLTRVRGFTQDDAHIICTRDQAEKELKRVVDFIIHMLKSFGFRDYKVYLSVRDPKNNKYAGTEEGWNFTEEVLEKVAKDKKLDYTKDVGGAVFYGPKLDFKIKDSLGREWQCSTLQYDFNLPEKFDLTFINEKGEKERPYMLHRALFGSFERFIGVLIEHYAGAFPVWLAPVQIKLLPIADRHVKYAEKIASELIDNNIRVEIDKRQESIGKKIREAQIQKIPYMAVIGDKEVKSNKIAVRTRKGKDLGAVSIKKFLLQLQEEINKKK